MYVIRPITLEDLPALLELTTLTGFGLTSLPNDEKLLRRRIKESIRGFEELADDDPPIGETYLFVMEHVPTGEVCGTCGIWSKVGGFEPFYAYRIETSVHQSDVLQVRKEIRTLHLVEMHSGPCEIGSLFLSPKHRAPGNGRLLSLSRFLFMAQYPAYFDPVVIAEMRGVVDEHGHSPFWDAVGHHFFEVDFPKADYLSMVNKRFIADLMPKHPLYIPLLPEAARRVIGDVHAHTRPALRMLEDEGFECCEMVDIFEAGPVIRCLLRDIRTVRENAKAALDTVTAEAIEGPNLLVSNCRTDFRTVQCPVRVNAGGGVTLPAEAAAALRVEPGESVRYATTKPRVKPAYHDSNMALD